MLLPFCTHSEYPPLSSFLANSPFVIVFARSPFVEKTADYQEYPREQIFNHLLPQSDRTIYIYVVAVIVTARKRMIFT